MRQIVPVEITSRGCEVQLADKVTLLMTFGGSGRLIVNGYPYIFCTVFSPVKDKEFEGSMADGNIVWCINHVYCDKFIMWYLLAKNDLQDFVNKAAWSSRDAVTGALRSVGLAII